MLTKDKIDEELQALIFDFFYKFSRFEFALKENGHVYADDFDAAQVDWRGFIAKFKEEYVIQKPASALLGNPPDIQSVRDGHILGWTPLSLNRATSDLGRICVIVKTVRNNLFHGGKHTAAGWDNPDRVRFLLTNSIEVLDSFAKCAGYEADYERRY